MKTITRRIQSPALEALVLGLIIFNEKCHTEGIVHRSTVEGLYDASPTGVQTWIRKYCTRRRFLKIIKGLAAAELIVIRQIRGKDYPFIAGRR